MRQAEDEIDRLYALPLGEFVAARNDLAKKLRTAGEREAADEVKALAKPSVSAWAVNQLAREERGGVGALLAAGERLRDAQASVLAGGSPGELRDASEAERAAVSTLVRAAERLLAAAGHAPAETTLARVGETLRAAAVDEEGRELLARGRVTRDRDATGFGPVPAALPPRAGDAGRDGADDKRRKRAETKLRELRGEVSELTASLRDAERRAEDARRVADTAGKAVTRERAQLEKARARLAQAEDELRALS
jgi:hypothetical protein